MNRIRLILSLAAFLLTILLGTGTVLLLRDANAAAVPNPPQDRLTKSYPNFELDVIVNGRPLQEYYARGRTYVEALQGAEYELRVRNSSSDRVAVALSVDGLNTIDARHTSAWNASKWVIEPYQTITISGWQMSSERARRFYFTNERDSYGAKLGQTANLGVISAVFFREQRRVTPPYPISRNRDRSEPQQSGRSQEAPANKSRSADGVSESRAAAPRLDDDYAATGIGRNVRNDVRWVHMDLDSRAAGEVMIRYEYYSALLRLGVVPRHTSREPIQRREDSRGFSPEP
ncbi:MAG TPA: hypothetical protein VFT48_17240 [Pyrinomonadaceae bacterium]|nr:hypothetical protein [Pyrinomonadaceae bacterium]